MRYERLILSIWKILSILAVVRNIQKLFLETKYLFTLGYVLYMYKAFITGSSENEKQKVKHSERLI